ncbi:nucleotide-diphospho-sugar transferase [Pyrenochaeta sp. DS3sAY3a]|nr:nucleotide-diphospho-sugar transferase [Pyrenochaeta sp. DS3sAY3a]
MDFLPALPSFPFPFSRLPQHRDKGHHPQLSSLSSTPPHPEHTSPPELAIATFLSGQSSDDDDRYFNLTRLLTYQFVHAPATRIKNPNITFAVLCGKKLSEEKKNHLRRVGAKVITLEDVKLPDWYHIDEARYSEVFSKLRVFEMTQFKRILFVDADILIMKPMDEIFEDPTITSLTPTLFQRSDEIHEDEGTLPKEWLFAARPENGWLGGFEHSVPPLPANYLNTGFFLIAPDKNMYDHLMNVIQFEGRFGTQFPEQDMLNYVFKREGPMPWRELDWRWCANFVNEKDYQFGIHSLHGKFWNEGPQEVRDHFQSEMEDMFDYEESLSL